MAERISDFTITFVDFSCFNTRCDVKDICQHYDENPTDKQKERFIIVPCQKCNAFCDTREIKPKEEPNRPYIESF